MNNKEAKTAGKKRQIHIRATEEEFKMIKKKAEKYPSVSSLLLDAVKDFDNRQGRNRIERMIEFSKAVNNFDRDMVRIGTNLNQIAHSLNLYKYGEVSLIPLQKIYDAIQDTQELNKEAIRAIRSIADKSRKR